MQEIEINSDQMDIKKKQENVLMEEREGKYEVSNINEGTENDNKETEIENEKQAQQVTECLKTLTIPTTMENEHFINNENLSKEKEALSKKQDEKIGENEKTDSSETQNENLKSAVGPKLHENKRIIQKEDSTEHNEKNTLFTNEKKVKSLDFEELKDIHETVEKNKNDLKGQSECKGILFEDMEIKGEQQQKTKADEIKAIGKLHDPLISNYDETSIFSEIKSELWKNVQEAIIFMEINGKSKQKTEDPYISKTISETQLLDITHHENLKIQNEKLKNQVIECSIPDSVLISKEEEQMENKKIAKEIEENNKKEAIVETDQQIICSATTIDQKESSNSLLNATNQFVEGRETKQKVEAVLKNEQLQCEMQNKESMIFQKILTEDENMEKEKLKHESKGEESSTKFEKLKTDIAMSMLKNAGNEEQNEKVVTTTSRKNMNQCEEEKKDLKQVELLVSDEQSTSSNVETEPVKCEQKLTKKDEPENAETEAAQHSKQSGKDLEIMKELKEEVNSGNNDILKVTDKKNVVCQHSYPAPAGTETKKKDQEEINLNERDVQLECDEKIIKKMENQTKEINKNDSSTETTNRIPNEKNEEWVTKKPKEIPLKTEKDCDESLGAIPRNPQNTLGKKTSKREESKKLKEEKRRTKRIQQQLQSIQIVDRERQNLLLFDPSVLQIAGAASMQNAGTVVSDIQKKEDTSFLKQNENLIKTVIGDPKALFETVQKTVGDEMLKREIVSCPQNILDHTNNIVLNIISKKCDIFKDNEGNIIGCRIQEK